jgi:hypothetical protein
MDISQLAGLIQLRKAATAVNKKYFLSLIYHDAGAGMRNRRGRSAQKTKPGQPINGFHAPKHNAEGRLNCQTNVKNQQRPRHHPQRSRGSIPARKRRPRANPHELDSVAVPI